MEMTKEIMHEQFKKLKSNPEKVKYLVDLKEMKKKKMKRNEKKGNK